MGRKKPLVIVTRKLPDAVETRMCELFDARLNIDDKPMPRSALAEALRRHASAAMDISDGLVGDLGKLCAASGVSGEVEIARVPLSSAARTAIEQRSHLIETVLTGGDDYEVVCTVPPRKLASFLAAADVV